MSSPAQITTAEPQDAKSIDWEEVRKLSLRPGGFGDDRISIWPRLLHVELPTRPRQDDADASPLPVNAKNKSDSNDDEPEQLVPHPDERQVGLDTDRSFVLYPVEHMTDRERKQSELHDLIVSVFRKRRRLNYFQGYHDIISVLLLTLPQELQLVCAEKLSLHRVRDSMGATLEPVIGLLRALKRVLALVDPEFAAILERNAPLPYFALSNLLTLFSHDMPTLPLIQHVFDYLLCRPPIITVYLAAALVLARRQEVEALEREGEEGMIHSLLSAMPDIYDEDDPPSDPPSQGDVASVDDVSAPDDARELDSGFQSSDETVVDETSVSLLSNAGEAAYKASSTASLAEEPTLIEPRTDLLIEKDMNQVFKDSDENEATPSIDDQTTATSTEETEASSITHESRTFRSPTTPPDRSRARNLSTSSSDVVSFKPRVSLSSLLERADELYTLYPPTHPSVELSSIMGPQSVMFTWCEDAAKLPNDNMAELMVTQPSLIVLPSPPDFEDKEKEERRELDTTIKKRRHKLRKPVRIGSIVVERKTVVASAVLVLGVAMAVYGMQTVPDQHHGASRELRKLTRYVGGLVLGMGGRFWDRMLIIRN